MADEAEDVADDVAEDRGVKDIGVLEPQEDQAVESDRVLVGVGVKADQVVAGNKMLSEAVAKADQAVY